NPGTGPDSRGIGRGIGHGENSPATAAEPGVRDMEFGSPHTPIHTGRNVYHCLPATASLQVEGDFSGYGPPQVANVYSPVPNLSDRLESNPKGRPLQPGRPRGLNNRAVTRSRPN